LLKYLASQIDLLPGIPYEFNNEPIDFDILKLHYSKKSVFNLLEGLIRNIKNENKQE